MKQDELFFDLLSHMDCTSITKAEGMRQTAPKERICVIPRDQLHLFLPEVESARLMHTSKTPDVGTVVKLLECMPKTINTLML